MELGKEKNTSHARLGSVNNYPSKLNLGDWPVFSANQTENRFALCRAAICSSRSYSIRLKDCYRSTEDMLSLARTEFVSVHNFSFVVSVFTEIGWGGNFCKVSRAHEGAFYPFVRMVKKIRPVDHGIIWIGTRAEYPRIFVNNFVANWLCPYSGAGKVMVDPFRTAGEVLDRWQSLSNRSWYPELDLPASPGGLVGG